MSVNLVRGLRVALVIAVFGAGYLAGTLGSRPAEAQMESMKEMGKDMMKGAAESGGPLGTAAKLGTAITEMQEHVDGLQQNIEVLNGIKSALGG